MSSYQPSCPPMQVAPGGAEFLGLVIVMVLILLGAPLVASYVIEYQWWREMKQVATWIDIMVYSFARSRWRRCSPLEFCLRPMGE